MMESSQGGAEVVSFELQPYRILYLARAKGGARAPCAPPWIRHCSIAISLWRMVPLRKLCIATACVSTY